MLDSHAARKVTRHMTVSVVPKSGTPANLDRRWREHYGGRRPDGGEPVAYTGGARILRAAAPTGRHSARSPCSYAPSVSSGSWWLYLSRELSGPSGIGNLGTQPALNALSLRMSRISRDLAVLGMLRVADDLVDVARSLNRIRPRLAGTQGKVHLPAASLSQSASGPRARSPR